MTLKTQSMLFLASVALTVAARAAPVDSTVFLEACRAKAADGESMAVLGNDGWLFLRTELSHLGKGKFWGEAAQTTNPGARETSRDPLAAIVAYNDSAKQAGIDLLFVPIPPKAIVYPEKLDERAQATPRLDVYHQAFYEILRERGVDVLDVTPLLIEGKTRGQVYCRTDSHYAPAGLKIVARAVAERIRQADWYADARQASFEVTTRDVSITGDLLRNYDGPDKPAAETLTIEQVTGVDGASVEDPASPVVLLTDSHGLVFHIGDDMLAKDAGVADHIARQTGLGVDLIGTRGSGATAVRISLYRAAKSDPGYKAKTKLIVWLLTAREFTEGSWSASIPVMPK